MKVYAVSRTQAGIERRAQQRQAPAAAAEPRSQERAPAVAPVTGNVVNLVIPRTEAQQIIADIAHQHGLTYEDMLSPSRRVEIVEARFDAIAAVAIAKPHLPKGQIGKMFRRDPKTILNAFYRRGLA
ncbi:MAG: hypothetical protein E5X53_26235 [Mesorhizobium sp.]|uniref:hypothetical protein n=1 Tax=Mesorhizobium sp. TaxID=1871066 RepID=UPI0011FE4373|nr:hypothetical protein [Mesorhizobium sp.]TIP70564.1 MAG: hypothetical protein E5X55_26485 [Mesorhizobium sp.]TIQ06753.1 MAG: hypothetical protein E5X57_24190 [Mesorhizobium sp.]TIR48998.1 MAG: hypothetical protein E5X53_26235 [Mesorhizobium sp.]TJV94833.1 MAG: hypothetical protein E5X52_26760 [Mesorhizobium sp.]